ncbi:glycosyltransferase family 2 protein [Clostridium beijerinckii]|jgi:Glycosyltransferases involved in cell wall biogenesis|uniref:Dolichol-phosphate mannosyltransferase n=2 Tax=Clostridium beijerinckii TaxID=1520 RepID=A0A1S8QUQ9_CLOBE|nr:glycosyltransferase family 2 protein [Clostridium beijerinckii]ABR33896.1 glycosyl transferase, family 2 [Clostridium beijerinckii NCIMB 8052]AIU02414.1 glycosyl transferase family protein [Clostridium beijerinckii ATCC 35702]AYK26984.1 glycosyltransferase [Clostridium beijerinckii NRRL B-598]MBF7811500.1 glycosyltransferase family 2 protein [Clostridium beijerinckii]NOW92254.1 dolichol-phosphate mannosyltransferase [Clostridium beijerinckii]
MNDKTVYSVIVPLYNEELVINQSYKRLKEVMDSTNESYEIVFVNDGSKDRTREIAEEICSRDENIKLINFSRNFGHQAAITAGMDLALGDAIIVIDADLQDPPEVMLKMIEKWKEGYEVVYGKRVKREGETFFKKFTARVYYRLLRSMTTVDVPVDAGDFRLIDRKVCNTLIALPERNRYVRGLVSWVGYKQTYVEFIRQERFAGETKYPLKKMFKLACDGITALSYKPLIIAGHFGILALLVGIILMFVDITKAIINKSSVLNFTMMIGINMMMFGVVLSCIGIMGQYIGRIFDESKGRPIYIISSTTNYNRSSKKYNIINLEKKTL